MTAFGRTETAHRGLPEWKANRGAGPLPPRDARTGAAPAAGGGRLAGAIRRSPAFACRGPGARSCRYAA